MKYTKVALSFGEQADLLLARGILGKKDELVSKLRVVNYYRLSGYWFPFREEGSDRFRPETSFEKVWKRYVFDRHLRLTVMDAIERVEVAVRTAMIYHFAREYGPFGYVNPNNFPKLSDFHHQEMLRKLESEKKRSKEIFVKHFRIKYSDSHESLPLWMIAELMTFGTLMTFIRGVSPQIKQKIATPYRISDTVLLSWLTTLNSIRNTCAHHGRLWNRELGYKPKIPRQNKHPQWHTPVKFENRRVFVVIAILAHMMGIIAPQSRWLERLFHLLDEHPDIPRTPMGFPDNWQDCPIVSKG